MKKLLLIILLIASTTQLAEAQSYFKKKWQQQSSSSINIGVTSLRTVRGWKHGAELSYNTTKNFQIGVFSYVGNGSAELPAEKYQGVSLGFPLLTFNKWSLGSSNRLGVYNDRFVSFLPTLKADYRANDYITASVGAGMSDRYPAFEFKMIFHLKKYVR